MRTGRRVLPLLLSLVLLLTGCGRTNRNVSRAQYKVWFVAKSTDTAFWLSAFAGANAAKAEYNVDLTIVGPETEEDYDKQNEYILQAAEQGASWHRAQRIISLRWMVLSKSIVVPPMGQLSSYATSVNLRCFTFLRAMALTITVKNTVIAAA